MKLTQQDAQIATGGPDEHGCLFFCDGRLIAVFVRLSAQHEGVAGRWYLEHGFGPLDMSDHPIVGDLAAAERWIEAALSQPKTA